MGRDSSVGTATRYRLDGTGIEFHSWKDFSQPARSAQGHPQPPIKWVAALSWGKAAGV